MKFRYLVGFAALALMASCSKQENAQVADDAWVYDESLPVPVTFAAPQVTIESKAVNPGKLENLNGLDIGVFACGQCRFGSYSKSRHGSSAFGFNDLAGFLGAEKRVVVYPAAAW